MKKIYLAPSLEIVKIKTVGMIATSLQLMNDYATKDGNGYYEESRRHHSVWDDDDYDE